MAIFNSYVKLPEGILDNHWMPIGCPLVSGLRPEVVCFLTELALASEDVQMGGPEMLRGFPAGSRYSTKRCVWDGTKWTKLGGFSTWRLLRKKSDFVGRYRLPKWHPSGLENVSWHLVTAAGSLYQGSGTTKSGLFLAKIIRPIYNVIFEDRGHRCHGCHRYLQCRLCL